MFPAAALRPHQEDVTGLPVALELDHELGVGDRALRIAVRERRPVPAPRARGRGPAEGARGAARSIRRRRQEGTAGARPRSRRARARWPPRGRRRAGRPPPRGRRRSRTRHRPTRRRATGSGSSRRRARSPPTRRPRRARLRSLLTRARSAVCQAPAASRPRRCPPSSSIAIARPRSHARHGQGQPALPTGEAPLGHEHVPVLDGDVAGEVDPQRQAFLQRSTNRACVVSGSRKEVAG